MKNCKTCQWIECKHQLPPIGQVVEAKIDNEKFKRETALLKRTADGWESVVAKGLVWWEPTHWRDTQK